MANPEIESPLDGIDKLTVSLYRLGLSAAALLLLCRGAALLSGMALLPSAQWLMSLAVASAICGFSLHIYDKRIRLILQGFGWGALALAAVGAPDALVLGAALATLSGLAFKEQFLLRHSRHQAGARIAAGVMAAGVVAGGVGRRMGGAGLRGPVDLAGAGQVADAPALRYR